MRWLLGITIGIVALLILMPYAARLGHWLKEKMNDTVLTDQSDTIDTRDKEDGI